MRKLFRYVVLIVCLLICAVSSHRGLMRKLNVYKASSNGILRSDRRYGDLYGMCYLPYFRKHFHQIGNLRADSCGVASRIDLYAISDSYFWSLLDSAKYFCSVDNLITAKINTWEKLSVVLDTSKINVLLFEFSERNIRLVFNNAAYIRDVVRPQQQGSVTTIDNTNVTGQGNPDKPGLHENSQQLLHPPDWVSKIMDVMFNKDINTNLESTLWDVSWFSLVKEFKATINYKLLNVVDKEVYVSTDRQRLYYNRTIDTSYSLTSSFNPVSDGAVDSIVNKMNDLYLKACSIGFRKVYLSIIPNPVSLLEPRFHGLVHKRLVERVQNSPHLKMPYINLIPVFNKSKDSVYAASDTHWTPFGAQLWVDQFNIELRKTVEER